MNLVIETIKNRRSIMRYLPLQINDEELSLIVEAGTWALAGIIINRGILVLFKTKS